MILHKPDASALSRVGKYRDIFENIENIRYFWYIPVSGVKVVCGLCKGCE